MSKVKDVFISTYQGEVLITDVPQFKQKKDLIYLARNILREHREEPHMEVANVEYYAGNNFVKEMERRYGCYDVPEHIISRDWEDVKQLIE